MRTQWIRTVVGTWCLLLCLIGCQRGDSSSQVAPSHSTEITGEPAHGDTFVDSSIADASNLLSILSTDSASHAVSDLIFDGLVRYDGNNHLVGRLAESWQVSDDGLEITFQLHPDVRFHDGVELTAEDVAFTYQTVIAENTLTAYKGDFEDVETVEARGPLQVRIRYVRPFAPAMASWSMHVLPKHLLGGTDINTSPLGRQPVGSGPYRFVEWSTGQNIRLERNPDYFERDPQTGERLPYLGRYIVRVIPDPGVQYNELLAGKIDAMLLKPLQYLRQTDAERFRESFNKYSYLANGYTYLGYNLERPLFRDRRVRQALSHAIDKEELLRGVLMGLGETATGPYKPGTWAHNPNVRHYEYDQQRAKELLAEAGWIDTDQDGTLERGDEEFRFTVMTNQGNERRIKTAEIIQQRFSEIGVRMDIRVMEWAAFINDFVRPGDFDAVILGWTILPDPDLYDVWHSSKRGPLGLNHTRYSNAEVDDLLVRARGTFNEGERKRLYDRFQEILAEEQPYTFLYVPYTLEAIHKRILGPTPAPAGLRYNMTHWYVPKAHQRHADLP